jgi:hypothetical protein
MAKMALNKEKAIKDLKMFEGLPPYDDGGNICRGDGYFAKDIERRYGMTIEQLWKETGFDKIYKKWQTLRKQML